MNKKFKKVKVGDKVVIFGNFEGEVIFVLQNDYYPIVVKFTEDWTERYSYNGFPRTSGGCILRIL